MAQPQLLQIKLSRFDAQPWGFRLQGGVDFATPLVVQKVNGGSLAEKAGLIPGDAVLRINDVDVFNLRHKDAQDVVVRSGNNFVLTVQRGGSTWRPHVTPTGNIPQPQQNSPYLQTVTKTSLAHKQQESQHIGCGYNNAARPFANGGDGNVKSIVNKQYNTPVGIYSDESIAETLSAQAEVLAGGVLGVNFKKNEKEYQPDKSEVLKFLREEETDASTPEPPVPANFYWTQSHAIGGNERRTPLSHKHQHLLQEEQPQDESIGTNLQENKIAPSSAQRPSFAQSAKPSSSEPADPRVIIMPVCPALQGPEYKAEMEAAAAALQHDDGPRPFSASGHPACALCGVGIVGVFVRIKDKNLHVECFKCATCGTSLKNQGYYNYNNKLYCDIHAKLAALQNPPPGTDGYVPVPIKPNTKLSANTISSALNAHGFSEIPVANGGSVAPPTAPQVAKPAETLDPPPPVTPDSLSTSQASTAISSTIANSTLLNTTNNINSSNNNKESEQLEGATQSIHGKSTNFSSGMLANPSSALDTSSNKQPFGEYVTLTGSVIRSVVPPGKGVNINYKVNQGYARPFGAAPAVAPKSPVAYPPQRPAINPYATLPRTNVGQQAGSITTGQSYLGAQQQLQQQQQQQTQILSHYEQAISTGSQSCINKPGTIKTCEIGDYKVQSTEKEVQKVHQNQSKLDSQTKIQIGDTQIESRRRVTEEYEHTQSARSVEIRTDSKTIKSSPASERRQSYGKTGYVANQARRLSGLEQEITNLTSQSQAISARAATLTETSFPQIKSPEPSSKFPTKPVLPPHDEPQRPNYLFSATPYNKMVGPPPGFSEQQQQLSPAIHLSSAYGSSVVSQQQQSLSTYSSSNFTSSTSKTSSLSSQANATNVGSLTKASITNNNIAGAASARTTGASAVCPVTGTFCRPGHTCCRQQQLQTQSSATDVVNYNQNNNLTYRTNASTGLTDIKTNAQATAIATANAANAIDTGASQAPHTATAAAATATATTSFPPPNTVDKNKSNAGLDGLTGVGGKGAFGATSAPKRGRGIFNKAVGPGVRVPLCSSCNIQIRGPFITALGRIWCPEHFICVNANCRRPLQDIGFVEEKGDLYCEYCFEKYLAPTCSKCGSKIKGDCLNAIGKQFHPECFTCGHCGKLFGNTPFFLEDGNAYCEADWNELFTTKCFACGFPVEAGDRWVEALNHNYHSQCFNCTYCKQNLEGQSFYNKGGRPFCKNHAR
ncbi:PREDICTED: PDZ and LIM domain protein Zasp isoform X9 [Bactrocera latifrons]|uniref:PDZ and LIM domain protein Zasp isoform X9 n=1 Tax=Bactrocera latifrons TaxID=174628 RepID=UPI0008DD5009|nr:PREDICTED: PDZ and LIM domain protein Zasp isoform X9 [Bactrocera latifrons]